MDELADHFPLNILGGALKGFKPPDGKFDPQGDWELHYGVRTIGRGDGARVGSLRLRRRARADGGAVLRVEYRKAFPGGAAGEQRGEIECRGDALSTPVAWRLETRSLDPEGKAVPRTRIEKRAAAKEGFIEVRDPRSRRTIPAPGAYTINWALFDAVQRLPREPFAPKRFTLLDDFDEAKAGQTLSFRKSVEVAVGGEAVVTYRERRLEKGTIRSPRWGRRGAQPLRLHGYDLVGPGQVPVVYWVDEQGRLLFVISGIEAYLFEVPSG